MGDSPGNISWMLGNDKEAIVDGGKQLDRRRKGYMLACF